MNPFGIERLETMADADAMAALTRPSNLRACYHNLVKDGMQYWTACRGSAKRMKCNS